MAALSGCHNSASHRGGREAAFLEGLTDSLVNSLSRSAIRHVGNSIGKAMEGRFLDEGRRVLILDKYSPYLRLFSDRGDSLWAGGKKGGGPTQLQSPQAIATHGDTALVFQQGRISEWTLQGDTLAWRESRHVPLEYFPLGIEYGCHGDVLLYARNDRQVQVTHDSLADAAHINYLYSATVQADSYAIKPLWGTSRDPQAVPMLGHYGVLIGRADSNIVVLHRPFLQEAGEIVQFDCDGRPLRHDSEKSLVTGDTIPVLEPRSGALEWPGGVVALPDGFAIPQERYFNKTAQGTGHPPWNTEVFLFLDGKLVGSVVIPRQWAFLDYDARAGVLMSTYDPVPHFVILPATLFRRSPQGGGR